MSVINFVNPYKNPGVRDMPEVIYLDLTQQENAEHIQNLINQTPKIKEFLLTEHYAINHDLSARLKQTLIPFQKPPETMKPEKRDGNYRYFAVVATADFGEGSSGLIRQVLGVWKIGHGQAIYKIKAEEKKQRLLKSIFFKKPLEKAVENARQHYAMTPLMVQLVKEEEKRKIIMNLKREQKITGMAPHMSAKYPIIETDDGVHLLIRKQPGLTLETWISWLQQYPQGLTLIQRLLLCINLYETLETQVHRLKIELNTGQQAQLIHRDIKPANIIVNHERLSLTCNIIDYGLSTYKGDMLSNGAGTPLYMEPHQLIHPSKVQETDDLFSLAIICAEIWGDRQRAQIQTMSELENKNKNIQFTGLFLGMNHCSLEQQIAISNILQQCTRFSREKRYSKQEVINAYKSQLLTAYNRLHTIHPYLQARIFALQTQLRTYADLDETARSWLDQEFIAADFLINQTQKLNNQELNAGRSLAAIWIEYRATQLSAITTTTLPADTPRGLQEQWSCLCRACVAPVLPNSRMLLAMVADWQVINRLSALFQDLKFIDIKSFDLLYNSYLDPKNNEPLLEREPLLKRRIHQHLEKVLFFAHLPHQVKNRFEDLCQRALDTQITKTIQFECEFNDARNLAALHVFYAQICPKANKQLNVLLTPEQSFQAVFNEMYHHYQEQIMQKWRADLQPYIKNKHTPGLLTSIFPPSPQRQVTIDNLFKNLKQLFQESKAIHLLPQQIMTLLTKTISQVEQDHQQGYLGYVGITTSTLADALKELKKDIRPKHTLTEAASSTMKFNSISF